MKRALFRTVNVLMAVIVLLSSTGFGLIEHSCQLRGKKISRLSGESVPCGVCKVARPASLSTTPAVKKANCCEEEKRFENVYMGASLSQLVAKFVKVITESVLTGVSLLVTTLVHWLIPDLSATAYAPNAPPVPYGRTLLALVQCFIL